jgi:ABC-2 type transport system permease protein
MTAFLALLRRDLLVAARNAGFLLTATLTQPALVVLVFGNLLPRMGLVSADFRTVMVPGLMSITMLMAGVQGVLMPLASDLSGTREVEERLLAPISPHGVALQRIVAGALQAAVAGLVALPVMILLMHQISGIDVHPRWGVLVPLTLASGLVSAGFGLNLGTRIQPRLSGLLFAVVIGPMMLFGCAYYPWEALVVVGPLRWIFLVNPLVFMSEAMRFAVTPETPHMPLGLLLPGLVAWVAVLGWTGAVAFRRRVIL